MIDNSTDLDEFSKLTTIGHWISRCWSIIFLLCGLLGNFIALLIFIRWAKRLSIYIYFTSLCLANMLIVLFDMFYHHFLLFVIDEELLIRSIVPLTCRWMFFFTYFFRYIFIWLVMMINIDRCFYLGKMASKSIVCQQRTAMIICLTLLGLSFVANGHFLIFLHEPLLSEIPRANRCLLDGYLSQCRSNNVHYQRFIERFWPIYNLFLFALLPMIIILICCILIIRNVHLTQQDLIIENNRRDSISSTLSPHDHLRPIAKTLICLDLLFPLTIFPMLSFQIYLNYNPPRSCRVIGMINLICSLAFAMTFIKNTFAFVIYYLTGNKFRRAFHKLIHCQFESNVSIN